MISSKCASLHLGQQNGHRCVCWCRFCSPHGCYLAIRISIKKISSIL